MKRSKLGWWFVGTIFILSFFTHIRNIVMSYYYMCQTRGNYTLAMVLMDKVDKFNIYSYLTGALHCLVLVVMAKIILEK